MKSESLSDEQLAALTRLLEGEGEPSDDVQVAQLLRERPELVEQFRQQLRMDARLRLEAEPTAEAFIEQVAGRIQVPIDEADFLSRVQAALPEPIRDHTNAASSWSSWYQWRPTMAAAAGLIFGIFCTSAVWAVSGPGLWSLVKTTLPVANAGFEEDAPLSSEGIPVSYGNWGGDYAEISGESSGVKPKEGRRMLRFLRSDSAIAPQGDANQHGNIYQVIDVRNFRGALRDGQAKLDWSAWFQWVPGEAETGMTFAVNVWSFSGSTSILPVNWSERLYQETAKSGKKQAFDETPRTWRPISGSMIVPADADFLVIELKAMPKGPKQEGGAYIFPGCFADQVTLTLTSHGGSPAGEIIAQ